MSLICLEGKLLYASHWGAAFCVRGGIEREHEAMQYLGKRECEYDLKTFVDFYSERNDLEPAVTGVLVCPTVPGLSSLPLGFGGGNKHGATADIPLDSIERKRSRLSFSAYFAAEVVGLIDDEQNGKAKERELATWEADLKRREQDIRRREEAVTSAGVPVEEKCCPPFFPIIHHDIAKEIPIHAQRLQYLAFAIIHQI